jgi:hypothetical protein
VSVVPELLPGQGGFAQPQETLSRPSPAAQDHQVQVLLERVAGPRRVLQACKHRPFGKLNVFLCYAGVKSALYLWL